MFTQLFGNYLINKNIVTPLQLSQAIKAKNTTRLKLGVLAINAGYMNSTQVEEVSQAQMSVDKRFGDIAVEKGYLSENQVDELLSSQKKGYLLIGQALVDGGHITNSVFEEAINNYKSEYKITKDDFIYDDDNDVIAKFYDLKSFDNKEYYEYYISLLFKNLIRFIGDDFTPLNFEKISGTTNFDNAVTQNINGTLSVVAAVDAKDDVYLQFASRFAKEEIEKIDDLAKASVSEFLNLHNGLFVVNMSNEKEVELELSPQKMFENEEVKTENAILIPVDFVFGKVNFIIAENLI